MPVLPVPVGTSSPVGPPGLADPQECLLSLGQLPVQLLVSCSVDHSHMLPVPCPLTQRLQAKAAPESQVASRPLIGTSVQPFCHFPEICC